jgi:hypothetical protein
VAKTLLIFVSFDLERHLKSIREFIKKGGVDVYLLYDEEPTHFGKSSLKIAEILKKRIDGLVQVKIVGVNPNNFDLCFSELASLIKKINDLVYIDMSSTTKLASAVTFMLALFFDVIPLLVTVQKDEQIEKDYFNFQLKRASKRRPIDVFEIPVLKPRVLFNSKSIETLKKISDVESTNATNLLRALHLQTNTKELTKLKYTLEKLKNNNLINMEREGNALKINITSFGKLILKAQL